MATYHPVLVRDFRGFLRTLSPTRRRWLRFLESLPVDPDALSGPLAPPSNRDFIICGSSRSGTTLLAAMLHQPPGVTTVVEPWDGMRLLPADLFASLRAEIDATGEIRRGRLDFEALTAEGAVRWCRDGERPYPIRLGPGYSLGVKWPAFWRYLDLLPSTKFLVCVRHPAEVIASFKEQGGRLSLGLDYETAFNRKMNAELIEATEDTSIRRILMYEYVNARILPHLRRPEVFVIHYERWFTEPESLLQEVGSFLGVELEQGPARVTVANGPGLEPKELELVNTLCPSARALGYEI